MAQTAGGKLTATEIRATPANCEFGCVPGQASLPCLVDCNPVVVHPHHLPTTPYCFGTWIVCLSGPGFPAETFRNGPPHSLRQHVSIVGPSASRLLPSSFPLSSSLPLTVAAASLFRAFSDGWGTSLCQPLAESTPIPPPDPRSTRSLLTETLRDLYRHLQTALYEYTRKTMRAMSSLLRLLLAGLLGSVSAQSIIPTTSSQFPGCAVGCNVLLQAQSACIPPNVATTDQITYENCFCQISLLQALYSTPDSVCAAECTIETDRDLLQTWFTGFCQQVGQGIDPLATAAATDGATVTVVTVTSTSTPTATGAGTSGSSASSSSSNKSWYISSF
jgi:hypothetical protein